MTITKSGHAFIKRPTDTAIHPTAIIDPTVEMDRGVEVGPFSILGEGVKVGEGTKIASHVVIDRWTRIGKRCNIFQFCSIGAPPQDMQYKGEKTETIIGDDNEIREYVTIHRATTKQYRKTVVGNSNLLMAYVHIAHDSRLGDHIIMANAATLGGHVIIGDYAIVGGLVAVHQFIRIGEHCIIGGASAVSKDVPPFVMAVGNRAYLSGLNSVGLRRSGFTQEDIREIKTAYKILFRCHGSLEESVQRVKKELPASRWAQQMIRFIESSKRGIMRAKHKAAGHDD